MQQHVARPPGQLGPLCVQFASALVRVYSGYSGFLPVSKDMYVRLACRSKLAVGMTVNACLYVWVRPAMGNLSRVYSALYKL